MPTIFSELDQILRAARQILTDEGADADAHQQLLACFSVALHDLQVIEDKEQAILDLLGAQGSAPPTSAKLALPTVTRRGVILANYQLKNDWVVTAALVAEDDEGNTVPLPDGAVFSVAVDDATMGAATMSDATHVTFNALLQRGTFVMTFHEAAGLVPDFTQGVDIVEDFTPTAGGLDLADATHTMQPLPPAAPAPTP